MIAQHDYRVTFNDPRQFRVQGDSLTLHVREWNSEAVGLPIVLLHGITGSGADWAGVIPWLGSRRAVAFDARGHGASDWDPGEGYTVDQHFADLASALDELDIARCVLVGFSRGGTVTILAAACLPDRVAGVAVVDSYPHPTMSRGSAGIARRIANSDDAGRTFDPAITRQFQAMMEDGHDARMDLHAMWQVIACPALVVRGEHSDVLTPGLATDMLATQPLARLVTIDGVGHRIPRDKPSELGEALTEFAVSLGRAVVGR